jgi:hypothetical protein
VNNSSRLSAKKVFFLAAIVVPLVLVSLITIGYSGLAGINPENQGKTLAYSHFSTQQAEFIRGMSVYALVPLTIVTGLLAALNLKFTKKFLSLTLLILCVGLVSWVFFASWATEGDYVLTSNNADNTLRIHSLNLQ